MRRRRRRSLGGALVAGVMGGLSALLEAARATEVTATDRGVYSFASTSGKPLSVDETERPVDLDALGHAVKQLARVERGVGEAAAARHQVDQLCDGPLLNREAQVGKGGEGVSVDPAVE
eukprot:1224292-Prymnesium_polylepis.1